MQLVTPNYSKRSPIVNHNAFTDARPVLGSPSATFNPASADSPLPSGAPRFVGPPGVRPPVSPKAGTNRRVPY